MEMQTIKCTCVDVQFGTYANQVMLPRPSHMVGQTHGSANENICVDACLKDEILALWSLGISTTGCCCGHNIEPVFAYIGVIGEDIPRMKELGYIIAPNKTDLTREDSFFPKTIFSYG